MTLGTFPGAKISEAASASLQVFTRVSAKASAKTAAAVMPAKVPILGRFTGANVYVSALYNYWKFKG
jgi:hypothetical protein